MGLWGLISKMEMMEVFRYIWVCFRNRQVFCKDDLSVTLTPSEKIESTDYFVFINDRRRQLWHIKYQTRPLNM